MEKVKVKRLTSTAKMPVRQTEGSAGYDLFADCAAGVRIDPGQTELVGTGLSIEIADKGIGAFVFARSGLAVKHGLIPANCVGVIDSDYRGEILIGLRNTGSESYQIQPGERIAQMVFLPIALPELEQAERLESSQRESGGFGSTGKF